MPTMTQAAFEALIAAKVNTGNGKFGWVDIPNDTDVVLTSTITLHQLVGGGIRGEGRRTSRLRWEGNPSCPALILNNCQGLYLQHFGILSAPTCPLLAAVRVQNGPQDGMNAAFQESSECVLEDIEVQGGERTGVGFDVHLYDADNDVKNDHHKFIRCHVTGTRHAYFQLEGTNAKAINITDCTASSSEGVTAFSTNNYGVCTQAGFKPTAMASDGTILSMGAAVENKGASFTWTGGALQGCREAQFYVGGRNDPIYIGHGYGEKNGRVLYVPTFGTGSSASCPILIEAWKYTTNFNTPVDKKIILVEDHVELFLLGCEFVKREKGEQLKIHYEVPSQRVGFFEMHSCAISNDGDGIVFTGQVPSNPDYGVVNHGYRCGVLGLLGSGVL
jgi:hypothetical protein